MAMAKQSIKYTKVKAIGDSIFIQMESNNDFRKATKLFLQSKWPFETYNPLSKEMKVGITQLSKQMDAKEVLKSTGYTQ